MKNLDGYEEEFPILTHSFEQIGNQPLCYFDNAATTLRPKRVIDRISKHYSLETSNVHRGVHFLSQEATEACESVRSVIADFIGVQNPAEIIFTSGTTAGLNQLAYGLAAEHIKEGDNIILSIMEHHSNIIPWQMQAKNKKFEIRYIPLTDEGELDLNAFENLLDEKTKVVSLTSCSNAIGTINPTIEISRLVREKSTNSFIIYDMAQSIPHEKVDLGKIDCDFIVFSGHKVYGPTGVGVLWGKTKCLENLPPLLGGGGMIGEVHKNSFTYAEIPHRFEAGTPPIASIIGLGEAIKFVQEIGIEKIAKYEASLLDYLLEGLEKIKGVEVIGRPKKRSALISFLVEGVHPHDIGTFLDQEGVAIRTGHHCAQLLMQHYKVPATSRASFGLYNTKKQIDQFLKALIKVKGFFA